MRSLSALDTSSEAAGQPLRESPGCEERQKQREPRPRLLARPILPHASASQSSLEPRTHIELGALFKLRPSQHIADMIL